MFNLPAPMPRNPHEDLQFQLVLSHIHQVSDKLALRQSQLILQSVNFLNLLAATHDKNSTEPSTVDASFQNRQQYISEQSSPRQRRAFKRKSKRGYDRPTAKSMQDALQEVKEVCSETTIAIIEMVLADYKRIMDELNHNDHRDTLARRKCENSITHPQRERLEAKNEELQEEIKKISGELRSIAERKEELEREVQHKGREIEKLERGRVSENACKGYLAEREAAILCRVNEIKLIEREITLKLEGLAQKEGCERCNSIRAVKQQIVNFRTYLQRHSEAVEKLYSRYKKTFLSWH